MMNSRMLSKFYRCPFYPTQKVVCVQSDPGDLTCVGNVYTINGVHVYPKGHMGISLAEMSIVIGQKYFYYDCDKFQPQEEL